MVVSLKHSIIAQAIAMAYLTSALVLMTSTANDVTESELQNFESIGCHLSRTGLHSGFHNCEVLLKEHLPSGLYIDLYQAENLHQFGGPKVYSPVDIDVELPEFLSKAHVVYVYNTLAHVANTGSLHADLTVPIHVRYHKPSIKHDFAQAILPPPEVFFRCPLCERQQ
jgi:hypothetical protein